MQVTEQKRSPLVPHKRKGRCRRPNGYKRLAASARVSFKTGDIAVGATKQVPPDAVQRRDSISTYSMQRQRTGEVYR